VADIRFALAATEHTREEKYAMCIICNTPPYNTEADSFLTHYSRSRSAMKASALLLKQCSAIALTPEVRKQYDKTHKKMVRLIREWNKLEQMRERATTGCGQVAE
jgi:hypothetical protein